MSEVTAVGGSAAASAVASRPRLVVVSGIGMAQIVAWGSSYYLPAVLAGPIAADTGWPLAWIVGSLSVGILVSGLVAPRVGRLIDQNGGRPVLATSAALLAIGLLGMAVAPTLPVFVAAWAIMGLGMGTGLYDPAFSTLGRLYGDDARSAITQVTLWGGFASTVCWPLSALLANEIGWRGACAVYAVLHVLLVLPLYLLAVPPGSGSAAPAHGKAPTSAPQVVPRPALRATFAVLAASFTLAAAITGVVSVHLLSLLQHQGLALATAVAFGALLGPSQVAIRIAQALVGGRVHPIWIQVVAAVLLAVGIATLAGEPSVMVVGIVLYAAGGGLGSIVRGTVPLAIFGRGEYGTLMGRLAMPTLVVKAGAPLFGSWLLGGFGATTTLIVLAVAAVANIGLALLLVPVALRHAATPR